MVEVGGRCLIDHQIDWLAAAGVEHAVVSAGYLSEVLVEHLTSRPQPLVVETVVEKEPLGRGGAFKFAARRLPFPGQPWFATNGDVWTRFSLERMAAHHAERGAVATLALARPRIPWGVVDVDELGRVTDFVEAPPSPYFVNAGIYVFSPEIVDLLPDVGDHERSTFPELARARRLAAYPIDGYWRAIDTAKDLKEAERDLASTAE
nr:nucleotidyltransferase family protein [Streptoalloteichus tenebrarius]